MESETSVTRRAIVAALLGTGTTGCLNLTSSDSTPTATQSPPVSPETPTSAATDGGTPADATEPESTETEMETETPSEPEEPAFENQRTVEASWEVETAPDSEVGNGPYLIPGPTYDYLAGDRLRAIDPSSGTVVWSALETAENSRLSASYPHGSAFRPVVPAGDRVYAVGGDGPLETFTVFELRADDGTVLNRRTHDSEVRIVPSPTDSVVVDTPARREHEVSAGGATDYCNYGGGATTGFGRGFTEAWTFERPDSLCAPQNLVVTDDTIVVETDTYLSVFDRASGSRLRQELPPRFFDTDDGTGYFGSPDKGLSKVDLRSGQERWTFDGYEIDAFITVGEDAVYIAGFSLQAVNKDTGQTDWTASYDGNPRVGPVATENTLWVLTDEGLQGFDSDDGTQVYRGDGTVPTEVFSIHTRASALYARTRDRLYRYEVGAA